jgi:twinkle protein
MTGHPSVSIPNGANSALKHIKENLKWVESFKKVYVNFDEDEAGNDAATEVMNLLKVGLGYRVVLPVKDANDLLLTDSGDRVYKDCLSKAQRRSTNVLLSKEEKAQLFDSELSSNEGLGKADGYLSGLYELDNCTEHPFLLNRGEITVLFAAASVGKSSVARQVAANFISRGDKVLYFALEETIGRYLQKIIGMLARYDFRYSPTPITKEEVKRYRDYAQEYVEVARLLDYSWREVEEAVEYAVRVNDVKLVIFDNLSAYVATVNKSMVEAVAEAMTGFVRLGKQFGHHTIVVSHTRRDNDIKEGEVPTMTHGLGGGGIERFADNVIGIGRVQGELTCQGKILKHRDNGETGEFTLNWNKEEASFNGVPINDSLRFRTREVNTQSHSTRKETSTESVSVSVPSDTGTELQPRLCDRGETQERLCGSEGETRLRDATETSPPKTTRTSLPQVGRHRGFPTVLQARSTEYLGLGE